VTQSASANTALVALPKTVSHEEHKPLCEACGYDLQSLQLHDNCPECGQSVLESHPQSRPGSPWQQRPSLRGWYQTALLTFFSPRQLFGRIAIAPRRGLLLISINCLLAAVALVLPWTGTLIGDPVRTARLGSLLRSASNPLRELFTISWVFPVQVAVVTAVLIGATYFEYLSIRFIASRRKWRLTRAGAWQVCAHASIGWLALALAPLFALAAMYVLRYVFPVTLSATLDLRPLGLNVTSIGTLLGWAVPLSLVVLGIFVFELLVHAGVMRCKYAATAPPSSSKTEVI